VITETPIIQKIKNSRHLPSLPQILLRLVEACNNEETTPRELSEITAADPSLTTRVLRLVNSSYTAQMEPVTSLEKAVIYLGADTIKNIAISASILQAFSRTKGNSVFHLRRFWWHSFTCAAIARRIAMETEYKKPEEAFLSGLLHDIAKLLLWKQFPKEYDRILVESGNDIDRLLAGEKKLGVTHAELGSFLIQWWNIDSFIADAVLYHHVSVDEVVDAFPLVQIVYAANALSQTADATAVNGLKTAQQVLGLPPERIRDILSDTKAEVMVVAEALNVSIEPPADAAPVKPGEIDAAQAREQKDHSLLYGTVKDSSLLYGTLENLIKADGRDAILQIAERSLKILFNIRALFFLLYDPDRDLLIGSAAGTPHRIQDLVIPAKTHKCLAAVSLLKKTIIDSFGRTNLSISDNQMIQSLGSEGMACLPLIAHQRSMGVIVAGIASAQLPTLSSQKTVLRMLGNHVATCLYVDEIKHRQVRRIQAERMEAASSMAGKVVHEVNNPLGIIKNYLKILEIKLPERHPAQGDIGIISEEIDRVSSIVRGLNLFAQPETKGDHGVDIHRLLAALLSLLRKSMLQPSGIQDHLALAPEPPIVAADENSLKQIFINLIKNAAEAMPDGGKLYVETGYAGSGDALAAAGDASKSGFAEITIRDDGPGIPENIKSRLFEPFVSTKGGKNRGLGLSIVHNIIQELHGTIVCESGKNTGTQFIVTLPLTRQTVAGR